LQQDLYSGSSSSSIAAVAAAASSEDVQAAQATLYKPSCIIYVNTSQLSVPVVSTGDVEPSNSEAAACRVTCTYSSPVAAAAAATTTSAASNQQAADVALTVTAVLDEPEHAELIKQAQLHVKTTEQHGQEAALTVPNGTSIGDASNATSVASYTAELSITSMPRVLCGTTPKVCRAHIASTYIPGVLDSSQMAVCARWHYNCSTARCL
jgi:hypothetical protein